MLLLLFADNLCGYCVLSTVFVEELQVHSEWYASFKLGHNVHVFKTDASLRPTAAGYPTTCTITIPTKCITQGVDITPLQAAAVEYRSPNFCPSLCIYDAHCSPRCDGACRAL